MEHEDAKPPTVLDYRISSRPHYGLMILPFTIGIVHFAVTWKLWHFAFDRFMRGLVGSIGNPSFHQPAASVVDRMVDLIGRVLMLPFSELWIDIDPNYVIAANSLCWAMVCWITVTLVIRIRRSA